ncbi:J domain-containing protein [Collinsella tanakaei]|uniref:J domain-containing protein n=1 Tax=Collinsella tanakaei TaxID=626935 RepID=UPI0022E61B1B|nr:J domain-containing protein [Collinsella tanakaei]
MNIWDVLEIEATSSVRAIKRAYARQLTKHHPEDDPEGFQLVQAAYERALLIARGGKGASEDVSPALRASVEAGAVAPEAVTTAPAATASAVGEPAASEPEAVPSAANATVPRPRIARPGGVFADVKAEAEAEAAAAASAGDPAGASAGTESDFIREKMLGDIRHREDALRWIDDLDRDLNSNGDALAALRRRPAAQYMDVDGADQAAANLLRPYVSRMRRRDLDQLEQALGAAAEQDALRALLARRRAEHAKHRRDVLSVLASVVVLAVSFSLRMGQISRRTELRQEAQQSMEQMRQEVLKRRDSLDLEGPSFGAPIASEDEKRALEAAAEANRAAILDYLRQAFGAEFTLEEDPSFVPGHTDTVMAIATDPAGARYAVMADVDEECRITEIRSAVEVDEEAASASSADAG